MWLPFVFLVWVCMGLADLIPWVSWWTIAFIWWIYERLINAIHSIDKTFFHHIKTLQLSTARKYIDWWFVCAVGCWIALAILLGATQIEMILETYPSLLFSFFSWLIIFSAIRFLIENFSLKNTHRTILWITIWISITSVSGIAFPTTLVWFFFAWILWSSAMILPWISWSYILLIIGIYEPVLESISALSSGDFSVVPFMGSLWLWVVVWLLILWRLLKNLYVQHPKPLIVCMTWLMIWALPSLLPIQALLSTDWQTLFATWARLLLWWVVFSVLVLLSKKHLSQ